MQTKTSIALEHFHAERLHEALAIFSTFRIGFNLEERVILTRAHEILSGHSEFYEQLGFLPHTLISQAQHLICRKYAVSLPSGFDRYSRVIPQGFRALQLGEKLAIGDYAWTWMDENCNSLGWYLITHVWGNECIDEGHVPVIRAIQ